MKSPAIKLLRKHLKEKAFYQWVFITYKSVKDFIFFCIRYLEWKLYAYNIKSSKDLCFPNFMIIGLPRCGTTWFMNNLYHHPNIHLPLTEPEYFTSHLDRSLRSYSNIIKRGTGIIRGTKSPFYCTLPVYKIRWIKEMMPDLKIILILRNPIDRTWSYAKWIITKVKGKNIEKIGEQVMFDFFKKDKKRFNYLNILKNYSSVFSSNHFKIIIFDEIKSRPKSLLRETFNFLGESGQIDWNIHPYYKKINPGIDKPIPSHYAQFLRKLYSQELLLLKKRLGSRVASWLSTA